MSEECLVLLDNGSLRPDAVLSLRKIAKELGALLEKAVHPVSLLHSSKIPADELDGVEAQTWRRFLRQSLSVGVSRFRVVPLFFGPSSAIADYLPKVTAEVMAKHGEATLKVVKTLLDPERPGDDGVARILADLIIQKMDTKSEGDRPGVIVVDHGSPLKVVADCRNRVAAQVEALLEGRVSSVSAASMERREGSEYDFNEPLLERALENACSAGWKRLVLSYLFFSPGRHAGPGGDIDQIVADSRFAREGGVVDCASLVGKSPLLVPLLARRYEESLAD
ncbi:sirohydrochlorin cobaltochelatase, putative [Verrucomicrobiia bacterium DG1235]|nr:sirohydrochlorin cobaltochelatase, putative [Verrucomicrobiae bacterium DG1235]